MTQTGSGHSPVNTVRGPTFLRSEIAKTLSALAHTCTAPATWLSASSTGSSSVGVLRPGMTNSPQTTSPSSNWHQSEFGYALISPRPDQQDLINKTQSNDQTASSRTHIGPAATTRQAFFLGCSPRPCRETGGSCRPETRHYGSIDIPGNHAMSTFPPPLPSTFNRLAWSNLAAQ